MSQSRVTINRMWQNATNRMKVDRMAFGRMSVSRVTLIRTINKAYNQIAIFVPGELVHSS
jgi:hypothetical protein